MLSDSNNLPHWKAWRRDLWMILSADYIHLDNVYLEVKSSHLLPKVLQITDKIDWRQYWAKGTKDKGDEVKIC